MERPETRRAGCWVTRPARAPPTARHDGEKDVVGGAKPKPEMGLREAGSAIFAQLETIGKARRCVLSPTSADSIIKAPEIFTDELKRKES